jgi:ADP-dependent NAD(P)H-hydrate dehydratase
VLAHQGKCWVILSGNSALAKAGTGDVLTGMIVALLAQKLSPARAAASAAYVHGRVADEWVRSGQDSKSLLASDIREFLPGLLARLSGARS